MRRSYVVVMRWMVIYGYEVQGGALNISYTELPRPWSAWESSSSRKNPHGRTGNRTRDLIISSQKLWQLDHVAGRAHKCHHLFNPLKYVQLCPRTHCFSYSRFTEARKTGKLENKGFINIKTHGDRERAVTWWNTAAQTRPVLDSSSFTPVLTLRRRNCDHSASTVLAVHISSHVIALFVFRKPLFIN
jgi:hypothetical protein